MRKPTLVLIASILALMAIGCVSKSSDTTAADVKNENAAEITVQEMTMNTITMEMSAEAKAMTEQVGEELGSKYFREDLFETMMRPSYDTREANSVMPTDGNGDPLTFSTPMTETMVGKNHVYYYTPEAYDLIVLYIHGGAYVHNAADAHAKTCDLLAAELNAKVCMPMYTLSPQGTWKEGFALMKELWEDLIAEGKKVILMGDSAGGGFALAFAEELAETNAVMPEKLVLFSPWVDVTMTNPEIADYESIDLSLASYGLIECGKMWAGELDTTDRKISPIYYENWEKLPETLMFVGTAEIFYPDDTAVAKTLHEAGVQVTLVEGEGLFHAFPVFTSLPEGTESRAIIKDFIEKF